MIDIQKINAGFGNLADEYDAIKETNIPVKKMRAEFYRIIKRHIPPPAHILEINCGSGIDAHYLAGEGYSVIATDVSDKMLQNAISKSNSGNPEFRKMDFRYPDFPAQNQFDAVISNLGGLNCVNELSFLPQQLNKHLRPGGIFVASVMPSFCLWEFMLLFRGEFERAFRRLKPSETFANVGGEKVFVKYHSPSSLKKIFPSDFKVIEFTAQSVFSPVPTAAHWYTKHPRLSLFLDKIDAKIKKLYPFSFIGDYYIAVVKKE